MATYTKNGSPADFWGSSGYRTFLDPVINPNWRRYSSLQAQLLLRNKAAKIGTPNSMFQWRNFVQIPKQIKGAITAADQKITLADLTDVTASEQADMLVVGDVIKAVGTGTTMYYVTAVDTTNNKATLGEITSSGLGTIGSDVASATYAIVMRLGTLGHTLTDAEASALASAQDVSFESNYLALIERWASVSKTEAATIMVAGENITQREFNQTQALVEAEKEYEKIMWLGALMKDSSNNLLMTKGFLNFDVQSYSGGTLTWDKLNEFARDYVTKYNSKAELTAFANKKMLSILGSLTRGTFDGQYNAQGSNDEFGMRVRRLVTDHVDLNIYENGALNDLYGSDTGILAVVDLDYIRIRYLEGNGISEDLHLETDLQSPKSRKFLDRASANVGIQVINPAMHSYMTATGV